MNRHVKVMKKTLEVDSKRKKSMLANKYVMNKLDDPNIKVYELSAMSYNKNVTKMSKESLNKRCKLFPLYDINTFIVFVNSNTGNVSSFSVKWYEDHKQIEAGVTSVHILCDPDTNSITFTTLYTIAIDGKLNRAPKISKLSFEFDDHEVVRIGNNTTKDESFRSVGYVLLENLCEHLTKQSDSDKYTTTFEEYFDNYSEITDNEKTDDFNIDNVVNLLSSKDSINDDELLVAKYL